jgi:hypothetical protein
MHATGMNHELVLDINQQDFIGMHIPRMQARLPRRPIKIEMVVAGAAN